MMIVELNGKLIKSVQDFHRILSDLLDFGQFYGKNLDALWDRLTTDVERPVEIRWNDSEESKNHLGDLFDTIVDIFTKVKNQDQEWGLPEDERFDFKLL